MEEYLEVLEYINIAITIFFLLAYIYRLFLLRHFAITEQYKCNCVIYISQIPLAQDYPLLALLNIEHCLPNRQHRDEQIL